MIRDQEIKVYNELRDLYEAKCYINQQFVPRRTEHDHLISDKFIKISRESYPQSDAFIHCGGENLYVYSIREQDWFSKPSGKRRWVICDEGTKTEIGEDTLSYLLTANHLTLAGHRVILPRIKHLIPNIKKYYLRQVENNVYLLYKDKNKWIFHILIIKVFRMKRYITTVDELFNLGYH